MKRLRILNIAGGLAVLLLIGSALWLSGGWGRTLAAPNADATAHYFKVGVGYTDVMPRQIVRTADDRVYIFAGQAHGFNNILVYWTTTPGVPTSAADFSGSTQLTPLLTKNPISVDAVYDGQTIIHVLINENCTSITATCAPNSGALYDHPFDITTNTFRPAKLISTGNSIVSGSYLGSGGVSGLFDTNGVLHVAYWAGSNHIGYAAFTYAAATDTLTPIDSLFHVDDIGGANHPILAVSPVDNSVTVAWISEASSPTQILARTKTAAGWGAVELVGPSDPNARVWASTLWGISIDQGPTLLITADGTRHLVYIQDTDSAGDYGHVRYATYNSSSGWVDQLTPYYTHDPALATNSQGDIYVLGHGHYLNAGAPAACKSDFNICTIKKNATGWDLPQLFAAAPSGETFDASVSVRWSVVGWNRPDLIEFVVFSGLISNYSDMHVYYGTLGSADPNATPTPTSIPIATATPTNTPVSTAAATSTPTATATSTLTGTLMNTPTPTATATRTATPTATSTPAASNGLVLALGLNENSGTTVADASGQNNTGALLNTTWTTGRYGRGLAFNGSNSWVTVNSSASLNLVNALTLEAWVSPTVSSGWRTIMLKELNAIYELYANTDTGPGTGVNIAGYKEVFSSTRLPTNSWSHVAATWDGATLRLYVNGVQVGSRAVAGTLATTSNPLRIGGNANWGEYFAGTIDEVRVYNRALSAAEIQADMNTPIGSTTATPTNTPTSTPTAASTPSPTSTSMVPSTPTNTPTSTATATRTATLAATSTPSPTSTSMLTSTPTNAPTSTATATRTATPTATSTPAASNGLVLALGLNENSGTTVADASGQNNTGALLNTTWTTGRYGRGLAFNGSNSWVTVNSSASLNLVNALTLEAWVSPTVSSGWRTIMLKELNAIYGLYASTGIGPWAGVNTGSYQEVFSSTRLPTNSWSHVAGTWDGVTLRLYVNGVQVGSRAVAGTLLTTSNPLRIGGNANWGEYFAGTIDEVRVYNRALSAAEIQSDMNTPIGP